MTNQTTKTSGYQRRTRPEWKQLIDEFEYSGKSAVQYCEEHDLSYQSFLKWRSTFNVESKQQNDAFIELTSSPTPTTSVSPSSDWNIEIELPGGVTLRMRSH